MDRMASVEARMVALESALAIVAAVVERLVEALPPADDGLDLVGKYGDGGNEGAADQRLHRPDR